MRTLIRTLLILAVLVVVAMVLLGYPNGSSWRQIRQGTWPTVGTTGAVNTEKARERGAELGEKAALATEKVKETAHDAGITTKIKAKMALDDSVRSRAIDVSTDGSTVTLSGTVGSATEHRRAIALARETDGVSTVIDRLTIVAR
jgi:osmotically-inducible protein OsmY